MRTKTKLEYIWLDGYSPQNIRSKIKIINSDGDLKLKDIPDWSFDGSSTKQAEGNTSDCILKPVRLYDNSFDAPDHWDSSYFVLCEVYKHHTNTRAKLRSYDTLLKRHDYWFGFEQEYFMYKNNKPIDWYNNMDPQGKYYCGVGTRTVAGRVLSDVHLNECLDCGVGITGTNAEVALGQWEYQIFRESAVHACDDLIISRYILQKEAEANGVGIELHPKPIEGNWNGSGCHVNFSTKEMREQGGKKMFDDICEELKLKHKEHMKVYGLYNDKRLTGLHETQSIDKFTYGVSDRGASIRIPINVSRNDFKGYLEDRRPSSNLDPYLVTARIVNTLWHVFEHVPGV